MLSTCFPGVADRVESSSSLENTGFTRPKGNDCEHFNIVVEDFLHLARRMSDDGSKLDARLARPFFGCPLERSFYESPDQSYSQQRKASKR